MNNDVAMGNDENRFSDKKTKLTVPEATNDIFNSEYTSDPNDTFDPEYTSDLDDILDPEDTSNLTDQSDLTEDSGSRRTAEIPQSMEGKRLDTILSTLFPEKTRSFWQNQIEDGHVFLDGQAVGKAGKKGKAGQQITGRIPAAKPVDIVPENIPLDILYEDEDLIVVNKPKGMVVHPAPGHDSGTLVNALLYHCARSLSGINGVMRPGIVHRIDRDTTGSLVAAKNDAAHECLARQFKEHSITRSYRAIVHGNLTQDKLTIDAPIGRHPQDRKKMAVLAPGQGTARHAVTHVHVLKRFGQFTYVECVLETGRTHQIRVHMAHIGHPVLGDAVYGPKKCPFRLEGQTLHAMTLGFQHPSGGNYMEFTAPLPEYFIQLLRIMER